MIDERPQPDDAFERFSEQMGCKHRDDYGSTIIIGEHVGDYPVCMECGMRFPEYPKRDERDSPRFP